MSGLRIKSPLSLALESSFLLISTLSSKGWLQAPQRYYMFKGLFSRYRAGIWSIKKIHVCVSLNRSAHSELSVRHSTGSWSISQSKFWQEPRMEYSKVKANPHRPTAAAALQGCTSHEPFKAPLPAHTLPWTFLTASPPWYENLRQLSPTLEMPAKGRACVQDVQWSHLSRAATARVSETAIPQEIWEGFRHCAYPRGEG